MDVAFFPLARGMRGAWVLLGMAIMDRCRKVTSNLTHRFPPKGSFLEGKSPAISGKSRLVKYYHVGQILPNMS